MPPMTNSPPELALLSWRLDKVFAGTALEDWTHETAREAVYREVKRCGMYVRREGKIILENTPYVVVQGWSFGLAENRT